MQHNGNLSELGIASTLKTPPAKTGILNPEERVGMLAHARGVLRSGRPPQAQGQWPSVKSPSYELLLYHHEVMKETRNPD